MYPSHVSLYRLGKNELVAAGGAKKDDDFSWEHRWPWVKWAGRHQSQSPWPVWATPGSPEWRRKHGGRPTSNNGTPSAESQCYSQVTMVNGGQPTSITATSYEAQLYPARASFRFPGHQKPGGADFAVHHPMKKNSSISWLSEAC